MAIIVCIISITLQSFYNCIAIVVYISIIFYIAVIFYFFIIYQIS